MTQEARITEWTCEHPGQFTPGTEFWVGRKSSHVASTAHDWEFALKILAKRLTLEQLENPAFANFLSVPSGLVKIQLCGDCYMALPSEAAKRRKFQDNLYAKPKEEEGTDDDKAEILARIEAGEVLYLCPGCNEFKDEGDLVPLRECPHCDETFDGNEGRNCPSCNRPFTRKVADMACPDCLDADALPEIATAEMMGA